jgi:hypothetical protein
MISIDQDSPWPVPNDHRGRLLAALYEFNSINVVAKGSMWL